MPKTKRRLWLQLAVKAPGATKKQVRDELLRSIRRGDYAYPSDWRIGLGWSNKEDGNLKWGEFTKEMQKSAQSSSGFDVAVKEYLEAQND